MTQKANKETAYSFSPLRSVIRALLALCGRKRLQDDPTIFDKTTWQFITDPKKNMLIVVTEDFTGVKIPQDVQGQELETVLTYLQSAMRMGLVLSYANPGYGARIPKKLLRTFEAHEEAYAALGYQPLTPKAFTGMAGWNKPLPDDEPICARVDKPETYTALIREAYERYLE